MLVTIFNDSDPTFCQELRDAVASLPGIAGLRYAPRILNGEVDQELADHLVSIDLVPSLFFIDPWGYRGLSRQLIDAAVKGWGSDCIFFFNYRRINPALSNPVFTRRMADIFGASGASALAEELRLLDPQGRELQIVESFSQLLHQGPGSQQRFVLPFRFRTESGARTSHYLIFVSKHFRGYEIMKAIMAKESTRADQSVPSFEYSPADERYPTLFPLTQPIDLLCDQLPLQFAGRSLSVKKIYEEHSPGTPYLLANYKEVLVHLEADDRVRMQPSADQRPMRKGVRTCADRVLVSFPEGASDG